MEVYTHLTRCYVSLICFIMIAPTAYVMYMRSAERVAEGLYVESVDHLHGVHRDRRTAPRATAASLSAPEGGAPGMGYP